MKAFRVFYKVGEYYSSTIILSTTVQNIREFVSEKDDNFRTEDRWCVIQSVKEIPLSDVMVKDLSVMELLRLLGREE